MNKSKSWIKNIIITLFILIIACIISVIFQNIFEVDEHITTLFVFAVFLISYITDGYIYGIIAAFISVLLINYAFTYPYFMFDFDNPINVISAIILTIIALLTGTLTTEIKRHEAERAENEKLQMRANLLRAISHDLRTPLTTIYGAASMLLENSKTLSEKQKDKFLCDIQEESEWLVHMVENLLSITKLSNGEVKIVKNDIVLDELIDSVIIKFKQRYPQQKIDLNLPNDIIVIPMDAILIEQVILNMLDNAMQHAKNMTKLEINVIVDHGNVVFKIKDNGCGINKNKIQMILTSGYYDHDVSTDATKHNMGIGMSVCSTIIKAHSGEIRADNRKSGGAVFQFTLPMEDEKNGQ